MSFYSNAAKRAKEAREAKVRLRQLELERQQRVRDQLDANSARNIRKQEVREIEDAKAQYQTQFQDYYRTMRDKILVEKDEDGFFDAGPALDCDPSVERDVHWNLFLKDHEGQFYNSEENRNTISKYFAVNNVARYDRWVLSACFKRLLSLGLLETAESQADPEQIAPEPVTERKKYFKISDNDWDNPGGKADDQIEGTSPETGEPWVLTRWQVERLDANSFKRFARLSRSDRNLSGRSSDYGTKYMG